MQHRMTHEELMAQIRSIIGGLMYECMLMQRRGETAFNFLVTHGQAAEAKIGNLVHEYAPEPVGPQRSGNVATPKGPPPSAKPPASEPAKGK